MRTVKAEQIVDAVAKMCVSANRYLPEDVKKRFEECAAAEDSAAAKEVFRQIKENWELAAESGLPLCQDTGLAVFIVEMGEDVRVEGMNIRDAINEGTRKGYEEGFLRKSACDPLTRANTKDNTPAIIHFDIVPGDKIKIFFMAKGGGSENMSRVTMLAPAQGWAGIKKFVIERVAEAGPNPCPPTMLGIGPMGLGGKTTVFDVKIEMRPCHIASLPLAVNIQCHSARHEEVEL